MALLNAQTTKEILNIGKGKAIHYNKKMVICGNHIELFEYENYCTQGGNFQSKVSKSGRNGKRKLTDTEKKLNRKLSLQRSKSKIKRLINANPSMNKFLTLTFKDNKQELKECNKHLTNFFKRLSYHIGKHIKYVCVPEFQERGAVHYHIICNLPFIDKDTIADIWGFGFIKIEKTKDLKDCKNIGCYISKYITADIEDNRLVGHRCFMTSSGLKKPTIITDIKAINQILSILHLEKVKLGYTNNYNGYNGDFSIKTYRTDYCYLNKHYNKPNLQINSLTA